MANERKGLKLRRCSKDKGYYQSQPGLTDRNEKNRLGRHLRHFPTDASALAAYDARYGEGRGKGHVANATGKGKELLERRAWVARLGEMTRTAAGRAWRAHELSVRKLIE